MTIDRGTLDIWVDGDIFLSINLKDEDKISFEYDDGHCSQCIETEYTNGILVSDLFNFLLDKNIYLTTLQKAILKDRNEEIRTKNKKIDKLKKDIQEWKEKYDNLVNSIKTIKEVKSN